MELRSPLKMSATWSVHSRDRGVCKVWGCISGAHCSLPNASVTSQALIPNVYYGRAVINGERASLAHIHKVHQASSKYEVIQMYEESIVYSFSGVLHVNYHLRRLINCNRKPFFLNKLLNPSLLPFFIGGSIEFREPPIYNLICHFRVISPIF